METENDERRWHLKALINQLENSTLSNQKRYFHVQTVKNLIFHLEEIKSDPDKKWIYETLEEYVKKCSEVAFSIDRHTSKELYYEYLDKLTNYYRDKLGFVVFINSNLVYFFCLLTVALGFLFVSIYIAIAIALFWVIQFLRAYKKYQEKRFYGLYL